MDPLAVVIAIVVSLMVVWGLLLVVLWLLRPRGVPVRELLGVIPDLIRLTRSLISDGDIPLDVRLVAATAVVWVISPIDLVPEFLPLIGWLDEIVVIILALRYVRRRLGVPALHARWTGSEEGFSILCTVMGS
jgi:uncharacterized membrane protein YkvA (DUF1232 family)